MTVILSKYVFLIYQRILTLTPVEESNESDDENHIGSNEKPLAIE